ncbi:MAG: hypothetical protein NVSMB65_11550 [Chloroflexota bacterium]
MLLVVLGAGSAWLFLTEGGRRRRDQAMAALGRFRPGQMPGGGQQAAPLPFPEPSTRGGERHEASPDAAPSAAPSPATVPSAIPTPQAAESTAHHPETAPNAVPGAEMEESVPIAAQGEAAGPTPEASDRGSAPATMEPAVSVTAAVPDGGRAPAPIAASSMPAAPGETGPTPEGAAGGAATAAAASEPGRPEGREGDRAAAAAPANGDQDGSSRREEILQDLENEIEIRAIGQDADVKVEDELDPASRREMHIPAAAAPGAMEQHAHEHEHAAGGDQRWVGHRRTMKAHPPGSGGNLPAEENRIYFDTREEVEAAGYTVIEREL